MMGHEPIVEALRGRRPGRPGRPGHRHRRRRGVPADGGACRPGRPGTPRRSSSAAASAPRTRAPAASSPPSTPTGFTIEPLDPAAACTPTSVAAHMLYETVNPFQMREPAGTLDVRDATYRALDDRRVRVEGSRFEPADQHTIKLEGARITGYETMSFTAIRDPHILARHRRLGRAAASRSSSHRVRQTLGLTADDYAFDLRLYGHDAVLDASTRPTGPPREVGVMLLVNAADQATATAVAKIANPLMLHLPTRGMDYLPSLAFADSPAETERGAAYEFVLNHVVDVDSPDRHVPHPPARGSHADDRRHLRRPGRPRPGGPVQERRPVLGDDGAVHARRRGLRASSPTRISWTSRSSPGSTARPGGRSRSSGSPSSTSSRSPSRARSRRAACATATCTPASTTSRSRCSRVPRRR